MHELQNWLDHMVILMSTNDNDFILDIALPFVQHQGPAIVPFNNEGHLGVSEFPSLLLKSSHQRLADALPLIRFAYG